MVIIHVAKNPAAVASATVDLLLSEGVKVLEKQRRGTYNLALPTGSTPVETYREFVRRFEAGEISRDFIPSIRSWNLDEYLPDANRRTWRYDEQSYWLFMHRHLFGSLPFAPGANNILNPAAADLESECQQYEGSIQEQGGLDLALVGIGTNGHIAFNEPPASPDSRTRVVGLTSTTVSDNAQKFFGGNREAVPKEALSMGIGTILSARKVVLIATGYAKEVAVGASVLGPVTGWCPASFFQKHTDCVYILDAEAASLLVRHAAGPRGSLTPGTYTLASESGLEHSLVVT